MICILRNVGERPGGQFCFCMAALELAFRRHIAAFLTQIDFAVFYLKSMKDSAKNAGATVRARTGRSLAGRAWAGARAFFVIYFLLYIFCYIFFEPGNWGAGGGGSGSCGVGGVV